MTGWADWLTDDWLMTDRLVSRYRSGYWRNSERLRREMGWTSDLIA